MSTAQKSTTTRKRKTKFIPAEGTTVTCYICNKEMEKTEATEFDGKFLCSDCLEDETFICSDCEEREWNDDNAGDSETPLCQSCYSVRNLKTL
ncbi:MAG: hypothetical protein FWD71_21390 [Oscillospiraceae bacterium]|nr:hypothetical protein [Oscillospiraceae bacterium]